MQLRNLGDVGIIGIFAVLAGLFLLWRHRLDIFSWFSAYILRLRSELAQRGVLAEVTGESDTISQSIALRWPQGALAIVAGLFLILAGQLALYMDLLS